MTSDVYTLICSLQTQTFLLGIFYNGIFYDKMLLTYFQVPSIGIRLFGKLCQKIPPPPPGKCTAVSKCFQNIKRQLYQLYTQFIFSNSCKLPAEIWDDKSVKHTQLQNEQATFNFYTVSKIHLNIEIHHVDVLFTFKPEHSHFRIFFQLHR